MANMLMWKPPKFEVQKQRIKGVFVILIRIDRQNTYIADQTKALTYSVLVNTKLHNYI
jgi:hypothetical protein